MIIIWLKDTLFGKQNEEFYLAGLKYPYIYCTSFLKIFTTENGVCFCYYNGEDYIEK
jgi:hypothetical protein